MTDLERRIAEVLTRDRSSGLCPLDGPCTSCDCFDPLHEYDRANAKAVMTEVVTPELERLDKIVKLLGAHLQGGAQDVKDVIAAMVDLEADRDRARDAAVALEQENARLTDDLRMHETVRLEVEKVLDVALGPFEKDGAGAGLVGDVMLLAERARSLTEIRAYAERCAKSGSHAYAKAGRELLAILGGGEG